MGCRARSRAAWPHSVAFARLLFHLPLFQASFTMGNYPSMGTEGGTVIGAMELDGNGAHREHEPDDDDARVSMMRASR